jgi:hypothetical protein
MSRGIFAAAALALAGAAVAADHDNWPGATPDCWPDARFVHGLQDTDALWRRNVRVSRRDGKMPAIRQLSPNGGYSFNVEGWRPFTRITIDAEKDQLIELGFSGVYGVSDVRWVNEKLLIMRPWWGKAGATDLIFDVEHEKFIYAESVTDGSDAFQQHRDNCPAQGCDCIQKQ